MEPKTNKHNSRHNHKWDRTKHAHTTTHQTTPHRKTLSTHDTIRHLLALKSPWEILETCYKNKSDEQPNSTWKTRCPLKPRHHCQHPKKKNSHSQTWCNNQKNNYNLKNIEHEKKRGTCKFTSFVWNVMIIKSQNEIYKIVFLKKKTQKKRRDKKKQRPWRTDGCEGQTLLVNLCVFLHKSCSLEICSFFFFQFSWITPLSLPKTSLFPNKILILKHDSGWKKEKWCVIVPGWLVLTQSIRSRRLQVGPRRLVLNQNHSVADPLKEADCVWEPDLTDSVVEVHVRPLEDECWPCSETSTSTKLPDSSSAAWPPWLKQTNEGYRQTERQKDRKTERQKDRQTDRQTNRKTDRETDRELKQNVSVPNAVGKHSWLASDSLAIAKDVKGKALTWPWRSESRSCTFSSRMVMFAKPW